MKLSYYIETTVPKLFVVPLSVFVLGSAVTGKFSATPTFFLAATVTVLLAAGLNSFNGVFDIKIDSINKPYRPLPSERISKNSALKFSILLFIFTLFISLFTKNMLFVTLTFLGVLLSIVYSAPPLSIKKRFFLTNMLIAVVFSILPLFLGWVIFSDLLLIPIELVLFVLMLSFGVSIMKDFKDKLGDKTYQVRTFPVVLGQTRAANVVFYLLTVPYIILTIAIIIGSLKTTAAIGIPLVIAAYKIGSDLKQKPNDENETALHRGIILFVASMIILALVYFF